MKASPTPEPEAESTPLNRTRRSLLSWGGAGLLTAIAGFLGWRAARRRAGEALVLAPGDGLQRVTSNGEPLPDPEPVAEPPISTPSREGFMQHLGSAFEADVAGISRTLKLVDVSPVQMIRGKGATYSAWSILFEHPTPFVFEGGICRLKHESMGTMELFLSAVGRSNKHLHIEAVFSEKV